MKALIAAALLACIGAAQAADYSIVVHGLSHHTEQRKSGKPWNEVNGGLGIRATVKDSLSVQVGAYRDSVFKTTAYALADFTPLHVGDFAAGGFAGGKYSTALKPILGALLRYESSGWAVTGRVGPAPQSRGWVYTVEFSKGF